MCRLRYAARATATLTVAAAVTGADRGQSEASWPAKHWHCVFSERQRKRLYLQGEEERRRFVTCRAIKKEKRALACSVRRKKDDNDLQSNKEGRREALACRVVAMEGSVYLVGLVRPVILRGLKLLLLLLLLPLLPRLMFGLRPARFCWLIAMGDIAPRHTTNMPTGHIRPGLHTHYTTPTTPQMCQQAIPGLGRTAWC